jgi:hypothetical protein
VAHRDRRQSLSLIRPDCQRDNQSGKSTLGRGRSAAAESQGMVRLE